MFIIINVFYFATLILLQGHQSEAKGQVCLQCDQVAQPSDCRNVKQCGDQELCSMRKFVTKGGHTWFDVGCSSSQRCSPITSVFGKRNDDKAPLPLTLPTLRINAGQNISSDTERSAGDTIVCEKCCSGDICNAGSLCGTAGFLHEMVCFNCSSTNEDRCTTIELCDQDEKCYIEKVQISNTSNHEWNTGCRQKELCQQLQSNPGTDCLSSCCSSDLCNRKCTRNNIDAMCVDKIPKCTNKTFQSFVCSEPQLQTVCQKSCGLCHCAPNPCTHGTCTSSLMGYKCACDAGYTGSICDRVIDHCNPDPCVQGTCYNSPHGYNCSCFSTDAGSTCGAINHCRSNPCIHGTCHDSPNGYNCACDMGFTGYTCDTAIGAPPGTLWKWADCGNPATRAITFLHLDIFPKPIHIPGNITTAYDITVNRRIDHLRLNLTMEKKIMNDWVFVPCNKFLGSCLYAEMCEAFGKCCSERNCSEAISDLGLKCPICPFDPVHLVMNYKRRGNRSWLTVIGSFFAAIIEAIVQIFTALGPFFEWLGLLLPTGFGWFLLLSGRIELDNSTSIEDYFTNGDFRIMAEFLEGDALVGCFTTELSIRE